MLLAEDPLLLLTDDATGKAGSVQHRGGPGAGGALLVELTLMLRVDVAGSDERVREGRLVVRDPDATGDGLRDEALTMVGEKEGKKPQSVVTRLGKRARVRLYERLVEGGVLRAEDDRILGISPTHRWPSSDAAHESSVQAGLVTALREGATTEARTGALISLLLALKAVHKTVDPGSVGLSRKGLNANAKRIAEGEWAAKSDRQGIDSMNTALIAATSCAVGLGGSSGYS